MKIVAILIVTSLMFAPVAGFCSDDNDNSSGNALGSALMGGLLGAGLGAAIGSASGHAGTGAAIGAGAGAIGGTLVGASQEKSRRAAEQADYENERVQRQAPPAAQGQQPAVKKRVIKEYDDQGNVISTREVAN